jgi:hypothetical protein
MQIETYKCLIFRGSSPIWIHGLQIRITRRIVIGRLQNNNRPFPVRERTFGELANGLCECPVVVWKPTNDNAACNSNLKAMNSDRWRTAEV